LKALAALAFLGVLVMAPLLAGVKAAAPATQSATKPAADAAATTVVKRGKLPMKFDSAGTFEAVEPFEVRYRPKTYAGELTINAIVANGAKVTKGDKLLEIDPTPLKKQLDAAENEATAAHANLTKAEADAKLAEGSEALAMKMQQAALKEAEDGVKWWEQVDGPQMLKSADLETRQYQHNVDDRVDELDQLKKMYKTEELTSATADIVVKRAVRGLELAKIGLDMEKERNDKTKTFLYPINKRKVYDGLEQARQGFASFEVAQAHAKIARQTGLFASRTAAAAADQKVSELRGDFEKLTAIAPSDGVVWYGQLAQGNWQGGDPKVLKTGEKIAAQQTILTLYAPGKLKVTIDLPEPKYFSVSAGTKATVTPTAFPELRAEGTCDAQPRTPVTTQSGPVYPLAITTGEIDPRIIPGMKASVHLDVPPVENLLLVPASAVVNGNAWVRQGGADKKKAVITGRSDGKSIEIVSGLSEGDEVLTQGKQ